MICEGYNSSQMTFNQTIANLFETKETLGVKHTKEIVAMADMNLDYRAPKGDENHRIGLLLEGIQKFVTPEPEPELDRSQL